MFKNALSVLALAGAAQAHMSMFYPAPLGGDPSINKQSDVHDSQFNWPLGCCGNEERSAGRSPGICRGHLDKFDTEDAQVTWKAGQDAYFQLTDFSYDPDAPGSTHAGGSCQAGFSVDKGKTWKVAASYHGNCPQRGGSGSPEAQTFDFKVPTGMPDGDALFAWIWLNREHESFMNCAKVKISGGSSTPTTPSTPSQPATSAKPPSQSNKPQPSIQPQPSAAPEAPEEEAPEYEFPEEDAPEEDAPQEEAPEEQAPPEGAPPSRPSNNTSPWTPPAQSPEEPESNDDSDWWQHWWNRHHREVEEDARHYNVDDMTCECRRGLDAKRCYCDPSASPQKRASAEKKALRLHRRTYYKRVDACDWNNAPAMIVSYYTEDATCAPNAKTNNPESDPFELSWDVPCGIVEGDGEYQLKTMECGMYGS